MNKYFTGMDTLRAIAIFSVILYHMMPAIFSGGFLGVNLFFVLSGFLMTGNLFYELRTTQTINKKKFYYKRLKRIYPSLVILLSVLFVFAVFSRDVDCIKYIQDAFFGFLGVNNQWQLISHVSYFDQFKTLYLLKHLWSLSIEIQFYLFFPIILKFINEKIISSIIEIQSLFIIVTLVSVEIMSILFLFKGVSFAYYSSLSRLFAFTIGAIFYIQTMKENKVKTPKIKAFVTLLLIITSFFCFHDQSSLTYNGGMFLFSIVSGLLLYYLVVSDSVNQMLSFTFLSFMGKRSYDMYLVYLPIIVIFQHYSGWDGRLSILITIIMTSLIVISGSLLYNLTNVFNLKESIYQLLIASSLVALTFSLFFVQVKMDQKKAQELVRQEEIASSSSLTTKEISSESTTEETTSSSSESVVHQPQNILFVGDSVMLATNNQLETTFAEDNIKVDAKVGRQPYEIPNIIKNIQTSDEHTYVITTGNNGLLTAADVSNIMATINPDSQIYFISTAVPRQWKAGSNQAMIDAEKKYDNVHIINWNRAVEANPDNNWFDGDDIHPNAEGSEVYVRLIQNALPK